jgi:cardiolipin synthase
MNKTTVSICVLNALLISGCQSVPQEKEIISNANSKVDQIQINGAKKALSADQVDKLIDKLTDTKEEEELLQKQLRVAQGITDQPLTAGNDTKILFDGEHTFKAMRETIESAKNHINLEYFIFEDVDFGKDVTLEKLLLQKRSEGVDVNIIYDALGSFSTPTSFFESLKSAGVKLTEYHPADISHITKINNRDHRKILVVDGSIAIVGGVNLSQTYQSKPRFSGSRKYSPKKDVVKNDSDKHWRDTDLLIKGPAVAELQKLFLKHWDQSIEINQEKFFPKLENQGNEFVRVIGSSPQDDKFYFYNTLIAAIDNSSNKIIMNSAYFVPTEVQKNSLVEAVKRGAKVDLMLPGVSDSSLSLNVQRSYYEDLLEDGLSIYEIDAQILHAKTISIDGVWSAIGSSNFDYRSATLNEEVDVIVLGHNTAKQLNEKFNLDKAEAKKIELSDWKKRSVIDKTKQFFSRIFEKLL